MNLTRRPVGAVFLMENGIIFFTELNHQCQECRSKDNLNDNDNDNDYINNQSINHLFIHVTSGEHNRKKLNIIIIIIIIIIFFNNNNNNIFFYNNTPFY